MPDSTRHENPNPPSQVGRVGPVCQSAMPHAAHDDSGLFIGLKGIEFTAPVYAGDLRRPLGCPGGVHYRSRRAPRDRCRSLTREQGMEW